MKNKILISVIVPSLGCDYNIFIPINERIYNVTANIVKSLYEITENRFDISKKYYLYDTDMGELYKKNVIVKESSIKNSSKLVLIAL